VIHDGHLIKGPPHVRIWRKLSAEKSVGLLSGPPPCGGATLARMISAEFTNSLRFNSDVVTANRRSVEEPHVFREMG
jgi:replication-associated recombination protein RarA